MRNWRVLLIVLFSSLWLSGCSLLDKSKAGLQVITNDVPSSVYLDGKYLDKTQYINKELKPGEYTLEIRPDNPALVPHSMKVSLKKGILTVVTWKPGNRPETSGGVIYEMEKLRDRNKSELSITTIPDGAIIHVDGEARGFAPVLIEQISPGEHEYTVELPSYETQKNTINVLKGFRMNISVKMGKQEFGLVEPTFDPVDATNSATLATPSASAQPSGSPAPRTSPSPSPRSSVKPSPSPVSTLPRPKVKILKTGFMQNGEEVLRVRASAGPGGAEVGFAPVGSEYTYTGKTQNGWHEIQFNGELGWVSGQYAQLLE